MLTVLESIKLTTDYLQKKGIESPRINAEMMLAKILNCKRLDLYLMFDRPLKNEEVETYRNFMSRRSKNEPLQYILGSVEFYGMEFLVNRNVLIPRPETEILVEKIIEVSDKNLEMTILDIGTGTGNIAISLAGNISLSKVVSIDISSEAIEVAKKNAELNHVEDKVTFELKNIKDEINYPENYFDIIVSNPPYISEKEYPELQPELKVYEPKIALTDDFDGLSFYRIISSKAKLLLKKGGKIFFEVGAGQFDEVKKFLVENGFKNIFIFKDYQYIERVISGEK